MYDHSMGERKTSHGFGTRAIRAATRSPQVSQEPDSVPIYQAVTFSAADAAELGDILGDRRPGYAYSRVDNPTAVAMAAAVAEIEGAEAGYAFATGMAAVHAALLSVLSAGDHLVATRAVYGSTYNLISRVLGRLGVETTFVDPIDHAAVEAALTERTRAVYFETISNPTIVVADQPALIQLAHRRSIPVIVDNTFASPYLCRPAELGADLVVESATKWLGGHSDVHAGVVVGGQARIARVREVQIDTGGTLPPMSAFLVLRGLETLHVRMERHTSSALALALARSKPIRSSSASCIRGCRATPSSPSRSASCAREAACWPSTSDRASAPRRCSTRSRSRRARPRLAACARSPCTRRPALIASSTRRSSPRRGSLPGWCASQSGWRTSTTCWPTSSVGWPQHEASKHTRRLDQRPD
jgi:cystathionine beta-lyase/cystathionine gamma-synthase